MPRPRSSNDPVLPVVENIIARRKERRWNQQQLADHIKVNVSQIARMESGKINPNIDVIIKCIAAFGVTATELFGAPGSETDKAKGLDDFIRRVRALDDPEKFKELVFVLSALEGGRFLDDPRFKRGPRIHQDDDGKDPELKT